MHMNKDSLQLVARRIVVFLGWGLLVLATAAPTPADDGSLQAQREVIVGVPQAFPPYYLLDEDRNPSGFAIDTMKEVAKRAGLRVTFRVKKNWTEIFKAFRAGDIDIIPSLGISGSRKQYAAFTHPVDTFRISLFVRDDTQGVTGLDDMAGRPVAAVADNIGHQILKKRTDIQLKVYPKLADALFALLSTEIDAFAYPEPVTWKLARKAGVSDRVKVAAKPLLEIKRAIAVRKDKTELLATLDRAVRDFIASPKYQEIYLTWFGKPDPYWTVTRALLIMSGFIVVLVVVMTRWRYRSLLSLSRTLRDSEAQLKAVFDNTPVCLNLKDTEGRYLLINKPYEDWLDLPAEEIIGKKASDFMENTTELDDLNAAERKVLETGKGSEREVNVVRSDGNNYDRILIKFPILMEGGAVAGVGTVAIDITERKRAEEAANKKLEKALEEEKENTAIQREFVSMVSHEFRTPLTIIDGSAQRVTRRIDKITPEELAIRMNKIRGGVTRMISLIEGTLSTARIEAGTIEMTTQTINLKTLVADICQNHQDISDDHLITVDLDELTAPVDGDPVLLGQVFTNLLSNAVKYSPENRKIDVTGTINNDFIASISVHDHGIGIPQDEIPKLFKRYFRATTASGIAGTGIGLNLVMELVGMHGGNVEVQSVVGEGSTFTVLLPTLDTAQKPFADSKLSNLEVP